MDSSLSWDKTLYIPLKINGRFGGICRIHPPKRRTSQAGNHQQSVIIKGHHSATSQRTEILKIVLNIREVMSSSLIQVLCILTEGLGSFSWLVLANALGNISD
jgi:hypothetical protein